MFYQIFHISSISMPIEKLKRMFRIEISVSSHPLKSNMNDSLICQRHNRRILYTKHSANVMENSIVSKAVPSHQGSGRKVR